MEYKSAWSLCGLPLVHISVGSGAGTFYRSRTARGWVAFGDRAVGILFACGGIACGGVAVGGMAAGLISAGGLGCGIVSLAGLAIAFYAVGGLAMGVVALGGMAIACYAAYGGLAIAWQYAVGGMAVAKHANDAAALELMNHETMRVGIQLATMPPWGWWLIVLLLIAPTVTLNYLQRRTMR